MTRADRDLLAFHVAFGVVAVGGLLIPVGDLGWRILALVVLYNVALPLVAGARGHAEAVRLWRFLVPLSLLQVVPDAFLADVLGVLVFPDTGGPRLGPVPLALAGMWTIPLFGVLWLSLRVERARGLKAAAWTAALASGVAFGIAEATLWAVPIWEAQNVTRIGKMALYVIPPEALLGACAFLAYRWTQEAGPLARVGSAALVSVIYLGALCASFYAVGNL